MVFTSLTDSEPFISFFCNVSRWRGNRLLSQEINDTGSDGHGATMGHCQTFVVYTQINALFGGHTVIYFWCCSNWYIASLWTGAAGSGVIRASGCVGVASEAESINKTTPPGPARVMCQLSCYDPIKWWIIKYLKLSFSCLVSLFYVFLWSICPH